MYYDSNTTSVVPQTTTETAELQRLVTDYLPELQRARDNVRSHFAARAVNFKTALIEYAKNYHVNNWLLTIENMVSEEVDSFAIFSELDEYVRRHKIANSDVTSTGEITPPGLLVLPLSYGLYSAMYTMDHLRNYDDFTNRLTQLCIDSTCSIVSKNIQRYNPRQHTCELLATFGLTVNWEPPKGIGRIWS